MIDRILSRLFSASAEDERLFAERRVTVKKIDHILKDMDIIDSKSAALLTHVSIMLAVVVVLVSNAATLAWQIILSCELLAFSFVGLLLLRCVDIMGPPFRQPPGDPDKASEVYFREIVLRRAIYQAMVRAVCALTLLLIVIVVAKTLLLLKYR